jgi:hypothetical protein
MIFLKPTEQLLQQIKESGVPVIRLTMQEFKQICKSTGKMLTNEQVSDKLKNSK